MNEIQISIKKLTEFQDLTETETMGFMNAILSDEVTPIQIASFLIALHMKGESVNELLGAAKVMRQKLTPVAINKKNSMDIVGTGGDGISTFNISTACAFVVAAAGATVLKHGNRSVSSSSGSADVLEKAGVNLNLTPKQVALCVDKLGVGFMFAPHYHPAMQKVALPRKELGVRTVFNLLGPLLNPAHITHILCGVYHEKWLRSFAKVFQNLGLVQGLVVHSKDGMDELSLYAPTDVVEFKNNHFKNFTIDPKAFDFTFSNLRDICVKSSEESLHLINEVFDNKPGPARDIVSLNAGAAIYTAHIVANIQDGVQLAAEVLSKGLAKEKFQHFIRLTQELSHGK